MKKIYIIGNWKSYKSIKQAKKWLDNFYRIIANTTLSNQENLEVILCVAYTHLYPLKKQLVSFNSQRSRINDQLKLAAQNVSPFSEGAYTGEVSASMMKELVDYCLIGHSERRSNFGETDEIIARKVAQIKKVGIEPILCVQNAYTLIPVGVSLIAYEPVWAIGSGKPATPEHANKIAKQIKEKHQGAIVIYGGSVNPDNVASFTSQSAVNGVLPGGASLDPATFAKIIAHAKSEV